MLNIYTDGACWGNGSPTARASYGVYCLETKYEESGDGSFKGKATNNTAELTGILKALQYASGKTKYVRIYADSLYAIQSIFEWRLTPVKKNFDLIFQAKELLKSFESAEWEWVKGHNLSQWNEYVDALATKFLHDNR